MRYNWHNITTNHTEELSAYAYGLSYEQIPPDVIDRAKMLLLQTIGGAISAYGLTENAPLVQLSTAANGGVGGTATAWRDGRRLSPAAAAFENGVLAALLNWSDQDWSGRLGPTIFPAAWAVAESRHSSGKDLLTAVVAGYETQLRIAQAVRPSEQRQKERGLGVTSWQIFGATMAAAKLMGLDAEQLNQTLSLGTCCSVIPTSFSRQSKSGFYHYEHGLRAREGIIAADLVAQGIHSLMDGLDDPAAYGIHMTDSGNVLWYTKELGQTWLTLAVAFHSWPADGAVQLPIHLVRSLIAQHGVAPEEISEIQAPFAPSAVMDYPSADGTFSAERAQYSLPYTMACAILEIPEIYWYTAGSLTNVQVADLAKRVTVGSAGADIDGAGHSAGQPVTLITTDRRTLQASGQELPAPDWDTLLARFQCQTAHMIGAETAQSLACAVRSLETCADIAALADLFHK